MVVWSLNVFLEVHHNFQSPFQATTARCVVTSLTFVKVSKFQLLLVLEETVDVLFITWFQRRNNVWKVIARAEELQHSVKDKWIVFGQF